MTQHVVHAEHEPATSSPSLLSGLCDQVVDAFTWSTDAGGRATALACLVHDLYETTAWRLNGTGASAMELDSLRLVLFAVDAHRRRMGSTDDADAQLASGVTA